MTAPQSMADELMAQLQGAPMQQMAQQLGASSQQIQSAVGAALPLLLGALGQNTAQPQGAAALFNALERDHGQATPQGLGGLGDLLGAVLGGAGAAPGRGAGGGLGGGLGDGAAILGHILGGNRQQAESQLGQATGLGNSAGKLLAMLAPMVMAYLANRVKAGNMDASALGQTLGQEHAHVRQQGGLGGGLLGSLLDQNGDGKLDASDLLKLGASLLGGRR
jgi:hypothetical protein